MRREIELPESKPAMEWLRGRAVQKVSPKRRHSRLQGWWTTVLRTWSRGRGEAGPEWRFRLAPHGDVIRPLVPDVAYLSYERMGDAGEDELEAPLIAPNVAVEILSPDDRPADVEHKIEVYLACGTESVIVVDPLHGTVTVHAPDGTAVFAAGDAFVHPTLPGLTFSIDAMLDELRIHRPG